MKNAIYYNMAGKKQIDAVKEKPLNTRLNTLDKKEEEQLDAEKIIEQYTPVSPSELARLESLSNAELIALVKRMAGQCGLVAMMSDDEREQALFDVLAHKGIKAMDVPAIKEYFDRTRGKPMQAINLGGQKDNPLQINSDFTEKIMAILTPDQIILISEHILD